VVLVGGSAGASIAPPHRGIKQEPGCHQPNAEQQDQRKHSIGNTASGMDRLTAKKDAQHPTVTAGSPRQR
jgi:hypothetical protein